MIAILTLAGAVLLDAGTKAEPTPAPSPTATPAVTAPPRRYCFRGTPTGTRIARQDCRTRAEWLDRGFDPLTPQA